MGRCRYPILVRGPYKGDRLYQVPCGKCPDCLQRNLNSWVFRMRHHMRSFKFGVFLTLTYDDFYLPYTDFTSECNFIRPFDRDLGQLVFAGYPTLVKSDVQKFVKRLRKFYFGSKKSDFSYYCIGEYGGHTERPHYHFLLFSNFVDVRNVDYSNFWHFGFFKCEPIHEASLRYVCKHHLVPKDVPYNGAKPFTLRSKGLGLCFVNDRRVRYYSSNPTPIVREDGFVSPLPRYLRQKFIQRDVVFDIHPQEVDQFISPFDEYLHLHPDMDIETAWSNFEFYNDLKVKRNKQKSKCKKL